MLKSEKVVLEILYRENRWMFGLEIVKASEKRLSRGGIYIHLSNLEDAGFVESRTEPDFKPVVSWQQPRHQFHITHNGRRAFVDASSPAVESTLKPAHG